MNLGILGLIFDIIGVLIITFTEIVNPFHGRREDVKWWDKIRDMNDYEDTTEPVDTIVCSSNYYNCADFSTCSEAMEVFNKCGSSSDIHYLDGDNDGIPCERYQGSGLC